MGFGQKLENLSFLGFQQNWPKQSAFCDLKDRNLPT